jgi:hypothetical protein
MAFSTDGADSKPNYVIELEKSYGPPSQSAFGSAVFFVPVAKQLESLEVDALAQYRYFVGETWNRLGEQNWINGLGTVYVRDPKSSPGVLAELQSLTDRETRQVAGLLLENQENPDSCRLALVNTFDSELVTELRIFKIGDGSVMSGVLIAARLLNVGSVFLVLLLD